MTVEKKTSKPKKTATTKSAKKTVKKTAEAVEVLAPLAPLDPPSKPSVKPAADKKKPSKLVLPSKEKAPVTKKPSRQANRRRG